MTTFVPNSVILYVSDVEASTTFYHRILGHEPIKTYPGFSVFTLSDDMTLGLQAADEIEPAAEPYVGGTELSLSNVKRADAIVFTRSGRCWAFRWFWSRPSSNSATPLWQQTPMGTACVCAPLIPRASSDSRPSAPCPSPGAGPDAPQAVRSSRRLLSPECE